MYFTYYSSTPLSSPSERAEAEPLVSAGLSTDPLLRQPSKQFTFPSLPQPVTQLAPSGFANLPFVPTFAVLLSLLCVTLLSVRDTTVFHAVPAESVLVLTSMCLLLPSARAIRRYVKEELRGTLASASSGSSAQIVHYGFTSVAFALFFYALLNSARVMPVSVSATMLSLSAVLAFGLVTLLSSAIPMTFPTGPCLFLLPSSLLVMLSMPSSAVSAVPTVLFATLCLTVFLTLFAAAARTVNCEALPVCIGVALFALSLVFANAGAIKSCFSFSAVLCAAVSSIALNFVCRSAIVHAMPLLIPTTVAAAAPLTALLAWPLFQEVPSSTTTVGLALHLCAAVALAHALMVRCEHGDKDSMLCGLDVSEKVSQKLGLATGSERTVKL